MAKKKVEEVVVEPAAAFTVTTTVDKNGATVTCVEGTSLADDNSPVIIRVGERDFNGGTTINGAFRAFIPATEEAVSVLINGEAL